MQAMYSVLSVSVFLIFNIIYIFCVTVALHSNLEGSLLFRLGLGNHYEAPITAVAVPAWGSARQSNK